MMYYSPNVYAEAACNMHSEPEFLCLDKEGENIGEHQNDGNTQSTNKSPCPDTEEVSFDMFLIPFLLIFFF